MGGPLFSVGKLEIVMIGVGMTGFRGTALFLGAAAGGVGAGAGAALGASFAASLGASFGASCAQVPFADVHCLCVFFMSIEPSGILQ